MRKSVRDFVRVISETIDLPGPIWEFGSFQVKGQEAIADLRIFFPDKKYVGVDLRQGPGVDIICDAQNPDIPDGCVGTVLMMDTLEHIANPIKACREVWRILGPNGVFICSTVMNFSIHDHPADYWRFTPEGLALLMGSFYIKKIMTLGFDVNPHTVAGIGFKNSSFDVSELYPKLKSWKAKWDIR